MSELKDKVNQIITHLMAIDYMSADIHYTAHGDAFYAKHLLVDKFNFSTDIDVIKEAVLLGNGIRPLSSAEYLIGAVNLLGQVSEIDDKVNFKNLSRLLIKTVSLINETRHGGIVDSILDDVGGKVLQYLGLINLQLE